jgi:nucleoid-associated protein YgaU
MQQIERYGVIALVFLLVTIVAISFWGDSKSPGFWSRLTGKNQPKKEEVAKVEPLNLPPEIANPGLPISPAPAPTTPMSIGSLGGPETVTTIDSPGAGYITIAPPEPSATLNTTPFAPSTDTLVPTPAPRIQTPTPAPSREYVVKSGDSFARIARVQLGAESRWREIADLNPKVDPKSLDVGQKLTLPGGAQGAQAPSGMMADSAVAKSSKPTPAKPSSTSSKAPSATKKADKSVASNRACVVQKGDTLRSIARRELGDERRWKEIASANPNVDPNKLSIGARLKLPKGEELVAVNAPAASSSNKPHVR